VRIAAYIQILTRVRSPPGVQAARWINHLPIAGDESAIGKRISFNGRD
jgi:hypothetical protein